MKVMISWIRNKHKSWMQDRVWSYKSWLKLIQYQITCQYTKKTITDWIKLISLMNCNKMYIIMIKRRKGIDILIKRINCIRRMLMNFLLPQINSMDGDNQLIIYLLILELSKLLMKNYSWLWKQPNNQLSKNDQYLY